MERGKIAVIAASVLVAVSGITVGLFDLDVFLGGVFAVSAALAIMAWGFPECIDPKNWVDWRE